MGKSQIRFTETLNVFGLLKGFTTIWVVQYKVQYLKTLFRILLLSNMQICYPIEENKKTKMIVLVRFCLLFSPSITKFACLIIESLQNTIFNLWTLLRLS